MVLVKGTLSIREDEKPKVLINSAEPLDNALSDMKKEKILYIRFDTNEGDTFDRVREALAPFSGEIEVRLFFEDTKKVVRVPKNLYFNGSLSAVEILKSEFGDTNVVLKDWYYSKMLWNLTNSSIRNYTISY